MQTLAQSNDSSTKRQTVRVDDKETKENANDKEMKWNVDNKETKRNVDNKETKQELYIRFMLDLARQSSLSEPIMQILAWSK